MSRFRMLRSLLLSGCTCAALLAGAAGVQAQQNAPPDDAPQSQDDDSAQAPGRVARLAYLSGQVQFAPAGEDDWGTIDINRPMVIGDRLLTGDDGRAALELGDASVRLDHDSAFDFLNLDENNVQIELSQGTLNLAVRQMVDGENFEVDTPTVAFVAATPGAYRIDDSPTGTGTMVTVFRGSGTVYGENGVSRQVVEGTSYRFNDSTLTSVDVNGLPQADDFDRFCETRDANLQRYTDEQRNYVPPEMIGGEDLYQYGQWNAVPEYGNVWYPRQVPVGWAPYRYGHWAWIDPWGWTWVDDQPWGFAPFHYGRWVYVSNRWGWVPGPINMRPVYAPALVAFVGGAGVSLSIGLGGGGPVGWFPLGPRDVYVPWFHASRGYFTSVNVSNIRRVYVNRGTINNFYNDYHNRRYADIHQHNQYRYRNLPGAITVVPRKVFTDARPVHGAVLKLNRTQLQHLRVAVRPDVTPGKASLGLRRPMARPAVLHGRTPFARAVVARHAPPPRPAAFAARQKVIASQHGQPLSAEQLRNLRKTRPANEARNERVKLVAASPTRTSPAAAQRPRPSQRPTAAAPRPNPRRGNTANEPVPANAGRPTPAHPQPDRGRPLRAGELPSARFRHPDRTATLPRPPVLRSATEAQHPATPAARSLPVVRPLQRAPRSPDNHAAPRQQARPNASAAQRVGPQQSRQQRQVQEQPQRVREQQAQQRQAATQQEHAREQQAQQRQAATQQERAREQQGQRQRAMQVQAQQRMREQQMQRQRQPESVRQLPVQQPRYQPLPRAAPRPPERRAPQPRTRGSERHENPRSRKPPASSSSQPR